MAHRRAPRKAQNHPTVGQMGKQSVFCSFTPWRNCFIKKGGLSTDLAPKSTRHMLVMVESDSLYTWPQRQMDWPVDLWTLDSLLHKIWQLLYDNLQYSMMHGSPKTGPPKPCDCLKKSACFENQESKNSERVHFALLYSTGSLNN